MNWVEKDPPLRLIFVWVHLDSHRRRTKVKLYWHKNKIY